MFHYYNIEGAVAHETEDGEGGTRRLAGGRPSWGQAPALHFLPPLPAANSRLGKSRVWGGALEVDLSAVFHSNHEVGGRKHYSVAEATVGR